MKYIKKEKIWVHPVCVNWNTSMWFTEDSKEEIEYDDKEFLEEQKSLTCIFCKIHQGVCIQVNNSLLVV